MSLIPLQNKAYSAGDGSDFTLPYGIKFPSVVSDRSDFEIVPEYVLDGAWYPLAINLCFNSIHMFEVLFHPVSFPVRRTLYSLL